jgi:hypothetical protein
LLPDIGRKQFEDDLVRARAMVLADDFSAYWEYGSALSMDRATRYALQDESYRL